MHYIKYWRNYFAVDGAGFYFLKILYTSYVFTSVYAFIIRRGKPNFALRTPRKIMQ